MRDEPVARPGCRGHREAMPIESGRTPPDDLAGAPDDEAPIVDAGELVGLLAEPHRLQVVAALALGANDLTEVRAATGLDARKAGAAVERLVRGELVERDADGTLVLLADAFRLAATAAAPPGRSDAHADQPEDQARVLRAFVRDGRLVSLPTSHAKRLLVLDHVVQDFTPGRHYPERDVDAILQRWHDDVPSLRRWLVDVGFLDRDHGEYWRCGGTVVTGEEAGAPEPGGAAPGEQPTA